MARRIRLCLAGGCPYAELDDPGIYVKIYDDTQTIKIQKTAGNTIVIIPKEWIEKISKELISK